MKNAGPVFFAIMLIVYPAVFGQGCPEGYYGTDCRERCSVSCVDHLCDKITGRCLRCPPGKNGDQCDQECKDGFYGPNCKASCSVNCMDQICDKTNGRCLRCPPGKSNDECSQDSTCPQDFCKNGGACVGYYLCNCSVTDFFGDRCQYTREQVPITKYEFQAISDGTIHTTAGDITYYGNVTLHTGVHRVYIAVPSGSYLTLNDNMTRTCLDDIDTCTSGFSLTFTYSFSSVVTNARQVLATTGAGLEDGVKGVSLYFQSGHVHSDVVTSVQQWSIVEPFNMADNEWFTITVSWHPGQGLWLLRGNNTIGFNVIPSTLPSNTEVSKPLLIGSPHVSTPSTVLHVMRIISSPLYWEELERIDNAIDSGDSGLEIAEIIGIITGVVDLILLVPCAICVKRRCNKRVSKKNTPESAEPTGPTELTQCSNRKEPEG